MTVTVDDLDTGETTYAYTDMFSDPDSEVISKVYHNAPSYVLYVELLNGSVYGYSGVSQGDYLQFKDASSRGRFWNYTKENWLPMDESLVPDSIDDLVLYGPPVEDVSQAVEYKGASVVTESDEGPVTESNQNWTAEVVLKVSVVLTDYSSFEEASEAVRNFVWDTYEGTAEVDNVRIFKD